MVMSTVVPAGTRNRVVCTHLPVVGLLMKYDTQSGLLLTVFCGSSCIVTWTCPADTVVKDSTGGPLSRKLMTRKDPPATTARNATTRVATRAGTDTRHHLA